MTEPDVTLTDYGLALLCLWFALRIWATEERSNRLRLLWTTFFLALTFASLTGGTVHGFFLDESTIGYKFLWPATLLAIGVTAASAWVLAGTFLLGSHRTRGWRIFAVATFILYAGVVLFYSQNFLVVILNYLPAMIALLIAACKIYFKTHQKPFLWILIGILISFVAAYFQQVGVALHPIYFNHNSTYHLVQAIGLFLIFRGAYRDLTSERTAR